MLRANTTRSYQPLLGDLFFDQPPPLITAEAEATQWRLFRQTRGTAGREGHRRRFQCFS